MTLFFSMKKSLFSFLALFPSLSLFFGCTTDTSNQNTKDPDTTPPSEISKENVQSETLSVIPTKCIGCGKCVHIDPSHFAFNRQERKAIVISQENISTSSLTRAVSHCPTRAIVKT